MADDQKKQPTTPGAETRKKLFSDLRLELGNIWRAQKSSGEIAAGETGQGQDRIESRTHFPPDSLMSEHESANSPDETHLSPALANERARESKIEPQTLVPSGSLISERSPAEQMSAVNNFDTSPIEVPESPKFGTSGPEKSQKVPESPKKSILEDGGGAAKSGDADQQPLVDLSYLGDPALLTAQFKGRSAAEISDMVTDYLFKRLSGHDAESIFINDGIRAGGEGPTLFSDADILNQITNQMLEERKYDLSTLVQARGEEKYETDMLGVDYQLALGRFREDVRKQGFDQTLFNWLNKGAGFEQGVAAIDDQASEAAAGAEEEAGADEAEAAVGASSGGSGGGDEGDEGGEGDGDGESGTEDSQEENVEEPEEEREENRQRKEEKPEEILDLQLKRDIEEGIRNPDGTYTEVWLLAHPTLGQDFELIDEIEALQKQRPVDFEQLPVEVQQKLGFLSAELIARQNSEAVLRSRLMDEHDWEMQRKGKENADEWWKEVTGEDWNEENNNTGRQRVADLRAEVAREMAGEENNFNDYMAGEEMRGDGGGIDGDWDAGAGEEGGGRSYGDLGDEYMYDSRMSGNERRGKGGGIGGTIKDEAKRELKRQARNKGIRALNDRFGLKDRLMDKISGMKDGRVKDFLRNRVNQAFRPQASRVQQAKDAVNRAKDLAGRLGRKPPLPKPPVGATPPTPPTPPVPPATPPVPVPAGAGTLSGTGAATTGGIGSGTAFLIFLLIILVIALVVFMVLAIYLYKLETDYQKQQQAIADNLNYPVEVLVDTSISETVNPQEVGYQNNIETTVTIVVKESGQNTKLSPNLSAAMNYQCEDEGNCPATRDDTALLLSAYQESLAEWSSNSAMLNHEGASLSFKANNRILEDAQLASGYRDFWAIQTVSVGFEYVQGNAVAVGGSDGSGDGTGNMQCRQPILESLGSFGGWWDWAGFLAFMTVPNPFYGGKTGFEHALELLDLPECAAGASIAGGEGGWSNISPDDWTRIQASAGDKAAHLEYIRGVFAGAGGNSGYSGAQVAMGVVECESSWRAEVNNIVNTSACARKGGNGCVGLFQVNTDVHCAKVQQILASGRYETLLNELKKVYGNGASATSNIGMCVDALKNPFLNTDVGWIIYSGSGWGAWSCYTGKGYLQYINNY